MWTSHENRRSFAYHFRRAVHSAGHLLDLPSCRSRGVGQARVVLHLLTEGRVKTRHVGRYEGRLLAMVRLTFWQVVA